jgi:hypothetical protein
VITKDLWITGFRALTPAGTHHAVVSIANAAAPEGDYDCERGNLDPRVLYAAGANAEDFALPAGIALHLTPGQTINLGLHVINASNAARAGDSGVLVTLADPSQVAHEAEVVLAGRRTFSVPARATEYVVTGSCNIDHDYSVIATLPIMHRLGAYQRSTVTQAGTAASLYDGLFTFGEERVHAMAPLAVHAGDRVDVSCTFNNLTNLPAASGSEAGDELCFTSMLRYPATGGDPYECVE